MITAIVRFKLPANVTLDAATELFKGSAPTLTTPSPSVTPLLPIRKEGRSFAGSASLLPVQSTVVPPSTTSVWPVTKAAPGLAR